MNVEMFLDRADAGRRLAEALSGRFTGALVVLGIPRGGVIVAAAVARALDAPLDVVVPRKIGAPRNPELAIGAIAPGVQVWDHRLIKRLGVPAEHLRTEVEKQEAEIERRSTRYRAGREPVALSAAEVVIVDDGIATGATATAAIRWIRGQRAKRVVVAVPVAPPDAVERLGKEADEVVVLETPWGFRAVGECYQTFGQTSDEEVVCAMADATR
jgi:putative phosphoribosyl transferase